MKGCSKHSNVGIGSVGDEATAEASIKGDEVHDKRLCTCDGLPVRCGGDGSFCGKFH